MPRRTKRGQGPRTRGRHKHFKSRETRLWNLLMRGADSKPNKDGAA